MNTDIYSPIKFKEALSNPESIAHLVINEDISIEEIKKFTNLKVLSVKGNVGLSTIYDFISSCKLTSLLLTGGNLEEIDFTKVNTNSLKELLINKYPLKAIHPSIATLKNLEYLNLSNCKIESFDIDLSEIPITYLDLSDNSLTQFNETFINPQTIDTIILGSNKIKEIKYADSLPFLRKFYIYENELTSYAPKEEAYPTLEELFININKLTAFPKIETLANLKRLSVSHNENIKVIPSSVFDHLSRLEYLELCNTGIDLLPQNILSLNQLTLLDISNNAFDSFPALILQLHSLKKLLISSNDLYNIPSKISSLKNLEYFDCSFCELKTLPEELFEIKTLRSVYLELNNFEENVKSDIEQKMSEAGISTEREI